MKAARNYPCRFFFKIADTRKYKIDINVDRSAYYKIEPVKIGDQKIERVYALRRRLEK